MPVIVAQPIAHRVRLNFNLLSLMLRTSLFHVSNMLDMRENFKDSQGKKTQLNPATHGELLAKLADASE